VLLSLISLVFGLVGFLVKYVWDYYAGRIVEADKRSNEVLRERINVIGDEIKSRLKSLETRFDCLERAIADFKSETQFALKSHRQVASDIYKGVEAAVKRAEDITKMTVERVRVVENKVETFLEWVKRNGSQ
jgi:hypothetical protein